MKPEELKQYLDVMGSSMDLVASKMGIAGKELMTFAIRQAVVDAINCGIGFLISTALFFVFLNLGFIFKSSIVELGIAFFLLAAASSIAMLSFLSVAITSLVNLKINPVYCGIMKIGAMWRGFKQGVY